MKNTKKMLLTIPLLALASHAMAMECFLQIKDHRTQTQKSMRIKFDNSSNGPVLETENFMLYLMSNGQQYGVAVASKNPDANTSRVGLFDVQSSFVTNGKLYINQDGPEYRLTANCLKTHFK